ncbi:MAG TPA: glutaredoxin domain-containing protein, partial [Bacillota bacterium]|nr:glutaredoxin domain-containing protein [Bacillota bacterium]
MKLLLFILKNCPYCKEALRWMDELKNENPEYRDIEVKIIDEKEEAELIYCKIETDKVAKKIPQF